MAYARRLLAELRLPAGVRRMAWPARQPRLLEPSLAAMASDVVDVRELYRVGQPMSAVAGFLCGHVPTGLRPGSGGQAGRNGRTTGEYVSEAPRSLPPGIYLARLAAAVIPANGGGSLLRVDAQVAWYPRRTAAEHIDPAGYRSVMLTVPPAFSGPPRHALTRTFTSRAVVARLAALLNGMPAMPGVVMSCPAIPASPYRITFDPAATRWPRMVFSPTGCFSAGVSVGGTEQPALTTSGGLIAAMDRLLGLPVR